MALNIEEAGKGKVAPKVPGKGKAAPLPKGGDAKGKIGGDKAPPPWLKGGGGGKGKK